MAGAEEGRLSPECHTSHPTRPVVAAVHVAMLLGWLALVAALVAKVPAIANRPRIMTVLQAVATGFLVVWGVQSCVAGIATLFA